jgi:hypothetical protein
MHEINGLGSLRLLKILNQFSKNNLVFITL